LFFVALVYGLSGYAMWLMQRLRKKAVWWSRLIVAISLIDLTSYKSMILLRHVIQQHHISILKRQPFNDWCFITSSASALGSISRPHIQRIATPSWRTHDGFC
jgi:hypothetical protein